LRQGSGGAGKHRGGDGIVKEIEFLTKAQVTLLSDRRRFAPYGIQGGDDGKPGRNVVIRHDGRVEEFNSKFTATLEVGEVLSIETPGGGGWGKQ
jgi:N-methylhydantoinase B